MVCCVYRRAGEIAFYFAVVQLQFPKRLVMRGQHECAFVEGAWDRVAESANWPPRRAGYMLHVRPYRTSRCLVAPCAAEKLATVYLGLEACGSCR